MLGDCFCRRSFYASHEASVPEAWRTLQQADKDRRRSVQWKEREEQAQLMEDDLVLRLMTTRRPDEPAPSDKVTGPGGNALRVSGSLVRRAMVESVVSRGSARVGRPPICGILTWML